MRKCVYLLALVILLSVRVNAMEYEPPEVDGEAAQWMPGESASFAEDLWYVVTSAAAKVFPQMQQSVGICVSLFAAMMLLTTVKTVPGAIGWTVDLIGVFVSAALLISSSGSMISLAADTVKELSEYGKLLLPVMAAALASQGGVTSSSALYVGTAVFDAVLAGGIQKLLIPVIYGHLILAIGAASTGQSVLAKLRDLIKSLATWCLKTLLTVFTAYISVTGVVSGTTDAAALKATKLTMSGMIPVVGGILSDASEAVIVGAGVMKNAVGVYGMVALIAIWIAPFLEIGALYLLLKLTAALCGVFDCKPAMEMIDGFGSAMGLLLGMIGACCILLLISTVCFMKGLA